MELTQAQKAFAAHKMVLRRFISYLEEETDSSSDEKLSALHSAYTDLLEVAESSNTLEEVHRNTNQLFHQRNTYGENWKTSEDTYIIVLGDNCKMLEEDVSNYC